jgi:predicted RNA-binding Zn-ribbon protein involved in translation (DUF1610 family)
MSSVMIRCPTTGRAVATAVETERSVFNKLPNVAARMHCPACGGEHIWTVHSAWLAETPCAGDGVATPSAVSGSEAA